MAELHDLSQERGREEDNSRMRDFWQRWGTQLQIAGYFIPVCAAAATCLWATIGFIRDTQAYGPAIHVQHQTISLVTAKQDRMSDNIELIMRALNIKPLPKSDTEIELERRATDADAE